jgi:hypothetical protein
MDGCLVSCLTFWGSLLSGNMIYKNPAVVSPFSPIFLYFLARLPFLSPAPVLNRKWRPTRKSRSTDLFLVKSPSVAFLRSLSFRVVLTWEHDYPLSLVTWSPSTTIATVARRALSLAHSLTSLCVLLCIITIPPTKAPNRAVKSSKFSSKPTKSTRHGRL